jgi:hypothetical protein
MICSVCGGSKFQHKVVYVRGCRLEGALCSKCGSGEASGMATDLKTIRLVRDTGLGEDRFTVGRKTIVRKLVTVS